MKEYFYDNFDSLTEYFLKLHGQDSGQNDLFLFIFDRNCGLEEDASILLNTVDCTFLEKKTCRDLNKIGIISLTRNCLHEKKVQNELTINNNS